MDLVLPIWPKCLQGEGGVDNPQNFADILYGWSFVGIRKWQWVYEDDSECSQSSISIVAPLISTRSVTPGRRTRKKAINNLLVVSVDSK